MSINCATIETGGKQYRVKVGDTILVERLATDVGETATVDKVLLVERADGGIDIGERCAATRAQISVLAHLRGDKVRVFKMRRRKKSRRTMGHRQHLSRVRVVGFLE